MAYGPSEPDPDRRAERDAQIRQMAFEAGMDTTAIAAQVGNITSSRVSQILGTSEPRQLIISLLEANEPVAWTARGIANTLHMDINKVQYIVDNLRKRGVVTLEVQSGKESGDHRAFTNIRLRKHTVEKWRARHKAYNEANGIPEPIIIEQVAEVEEQPTEAPVEAIAAHEIPTYPLLWGLVDRDRKIAEAAKLLEGAGLDDLALAALARADDFTSLEREYMRYAQEHNHSDHSDV